MNFNGDIIITDPYCILNNHNDWTLCEHGVNMEKLGLKTFISQETQEEDWDCTVKSLDTNEILGEVSSDSGMIGVFLMDEVLAYNPDFKPETNYSLTIIRGFEGIIDVMREQYCGSYVKGTGNINFKSY